MKDDTKTSVFPCNIGDTVYEVEEGQNSFFNKGRGKEGVIW